jgi:Fic family protein
MRETGIYQRLGNLDYFLPHPLPPTNPPLELSGEMMLLYGEASFALGQLNEKCLRLPDPKRFIKAYVIKEALLSSAIEGIHTTLLEIFTTPLDLSNSSKNIRPKKDTQLVLNYINALEAALEMIQMDGFPLVARVILRAHEVLLSVGENDISSPGFFRKQSVSVGNLIPPLAPAIPELISDLEKYINESKQNSTALPPLIQAGLAHVQFETIHPFLDGNGRIGRLLIVLMLIDSDLLRLPILYPSYYFKKYQTEYYQKLDRVRTHGDFEGWISYYLMAIRDSAIDAYRRATEIEELEIKLKNLLQNDVRFTKMRGSAGEILNLLFSRPVAGVAEMSKTLGKSYNTVDKILKEFVTMGFVSETIVHKRNKLYRFEAYLELLEKEY